MSGRPSEVFLSHATADTLMAGAFVSTFVSHGMPVWYSQSNLLSGQYWQDETGRALDRCDWFIVLTSRAAAESMWVKRETQYALGQTRLDGRISAIALEDTNASAVGWALDTVQQTRVHGHFDAACASVLRAWEPGWTLAT